MIVELYPQVLTAAAFAPFGQVIEMEGHKPLIINEGTTQRFNDLAKVDVATLGGRSQISIFRGQPRSQPIEIAMMERHPLGSQAFIPLQRLSYLVVVAPPAAQARASDLIAFLAQGHQGVNYDRAVWHHPLLVLSQDQEFLVIDRGGEGDNLQEYWFEADAGAQIIGDQ